MKTLVYVETTVVSYLMGRTSKNAIVAAHQEITRKWWRERAPGFDLAISELVYREASVGDPKASASRRKVLEGLMRQAVAALSFALLKNSWRNSHVQRSDC